MLNFRVADFNFQIRVDNEASMYERMHNYHPFTFSSSDNIEGIPVFALSLDRKVTIPTEEPIKTFDYEIESADVCLRIYSDRYLLSVITKPNQKDNNTRDYHLDCPLTTYCDKEAGCLFTSNYGAQDYERNPYILDHLLTFAFSLATSGLKTLLIHASTIVFQGKAVMFLAESGTGKSTHTRLWRENIEGAKLLNDDAPAMRIIGGKAYAYGTPWSGKLPCYKNEKYPLAACVRIRRAPYNKIDLQQGIQAFGAVLPSTLPTLQLEESMLDNICDTISELLNSTPTYVLDCLPDRDAAILSCSEIFNS